MSAQPSRIARAYAGQAWPDVQMQRKLAAGVYAFSCAGHGGIVAVIGAANFPAELVELARKHGKTEWAADHHRRIITSERYTVDTFARLAAGGHDVYELWAGEEDCDWALIALASDEVLDAIAEKWTGETRDEVAAYVRENAERWNPEYVADLDALRVAA